MKWIKWNNGVIKYDEIIIMKMKMIMWNNEKW